jgi:hypothetical protein
MTHTLKGMLILFAAVVIASTTFAFASSSTRVPGSKGEGAGDISGYAVTNVTYQFNADPTRIDSVMFTLDSKAVTVKIKLNDTAPTWFSCSPVTGKDWSCRTDGASTQAANTLQVFAAGN